VPQQPVLWALYNASLRATLRSEFLVGFFVPAFMPGSDPGLSRMILNLSVRPSVGKHILASSFDAKVMGMIVVYIRSNPFIRATAVTAMPIFRVMELRKAC